MKKIVIIIPIIFVIIALCFVIMLSFAHCQILKAGDVTAEKYSSYIVEKDDYIIKTYISTENDMKFVKFKVIDNKTNEVLFSPDNKWRVIDFKKIDFQNNSYNIIVESGDIGTTVYKHDGNYWIEQE